MDTELLTLAELFIWANAMEEERFVPIKDFGGRFWISDFGRIVSCDHRKNTIKMLKPCPDSSGYYNTQLRMKPINKRVRVHVLVAEHFIAKTDTSYNCVNHLHGIKLCNYYKDLEWTTIGENIRHAFTTGLNNHRGSNHKMSKLQEADVIQIRELHRNGIPNKEIANKFNVSPRQIRDIVKRINWEWLK